ncbi:hypothetical protein FQA39_LY10959 [Lamprigera yunnana]|nr:hypothetical protein FQA39_LY10959 [Lamprigera yunnana]
MALHMTLRSRRLVELTLEQAQKAETDGLTTHIENDPILFMHEVNVPDRNLFRKWTAQCPEPHVIHINQESSAEQEYTKETFEPNLVQTFQDPPVKCECTTEFSEPYLILTNKEEQHNVQILQNMQVEPQLSLMSATQQTVQLYMTLF